MSSSLRLCFQWEEAFSLSLNIPDLDGRTLLCTGPAELTTTWKSSRRCWTLKVDHLALLRATNDGWMPESIGTFRNSGNTNQLEGLR